MSDQNYIVEKRALQILILLGACVPVFGGATGMIFGDASPTGAADLWLDSQVRYMSGLLFAVGLGFWAAIPAIERKTAHVRLLTFLVLTGGLARLAGAIFVGVSSTATIFTIGMELVVTPLLCLWQSRISALSKQAALQDRGVNQ